MRGLPAGWYTDPSRGPLEHSKIFARGWQFVCLGSDLPAAGNAARFDCAGRSAVVLRTSGGALRAFINACRHRGSRLVDGDPNTGFAHCLDGRLRCPYHGWTYDETGALESIPADQEFSALDGATSGLVPVSVEQWRGLVFVAFDAPEHSLADSLATVEAWPDAAALRRLHEPRVTSLEADWKLVCEHLLDRTHFGVARPNLKPRVFAAALFEPKGSVALQARAALADTGAASWSARASQHWLGEAGRAELLYVWPNVLFQFSRDALVATQVLPTSTGRCRLREIAYGAADPSREMRLLRYAHARVRRRARSEDRRIVERTQQGLESVNGADCGAIAATEPGLRWFAVRCQTMLGEQPKARKKRTADSG